MTPVPGDPALDAVDAVDAVDVDGAALFAAERPRLVGLAYRLLGGVADAEDVVQEAWLRWSRVDRTTIERPAAWLTTVVSRIGIDRLRAARRSRVDYVGPWLPEPIVEPLEHGRAGTDPAAAAELSDSLTTAFLVLLERLGPEERLVVLLVDVFGESFRTAAAALDRSEEATRQLAVRARRKLRSEPARRPDAPDELLAVATAFVGAVLAGDLALVRSMLSTDAVLVSDGGARQHAARRPVRGADRVARFIVNVTKRVVALPVQIEPAWVNGRPGVVTRLGGTVIAVSAVEVRDGHVERAWMTLNPDKLRHVGMHPPLN